MDDGSDLAADLRRLEEELLLPHVRHSRPELEARLAPEFVEFGASGRVYDREAIVAALAAEDEPPAVVVERFAADLLAPDVALATFLLRGATDAAGQTAVASNRSSIWRRDGGRWRLVFHQGTPTR